MALCRCGKHFDDLGWKTMCPRCFFMKDFEKEQADDKLRQEAEILRYRLKERPRAISAERLRQLVQLCHPDKHNNSALSQEVTAWLLTMRKH